MTATHLIWTIHKVGPSASALLYGVIEFSDNGLGILGSY